ncbi:flavin reductase family protein [Faecalispora jeddahensis]|uniref:flavin reductase family protein n=1 Tax=Faecalispora jeddahensis TaxID=1414721 RepID=UPI0018990A32|nr:flavin reductase family protein [Faecalispora jeddahensis]
MNYDGLSKLGYGVYLVGAPDGKGGGNALLANLVMQVSSEPLMACVCIGKENLTHDQIAAAGKFNISVVGEMADMEFLQLFGFSSGRDTDKLAKTENRDYNGFPTVVQNCVALLECEVTGQTDCGASTVYFANVLSTRTLAPGKAMTSAYYHDVMEGKTSQKAPAWAARYEK